MHFALILNEQFSSLVPHWTVTVILFKTQELSSTGSPSLPTPHHTTCLCQPEQDQAKARGQELGVVLPDVSQHLLSPRVLDWNVGSEAGWPGLEQGTSIWDVVSCCPDTCARLQTLLQDLRTLRKWMLAVAAAERSQQVRSREERFQGTEETVGFGVVAVGASALCHLPSWPCVGASAGTFVCSQSHHGCLYMLSAPVHTGPWARTSRGTTSVVVQVSKGTEPVYVHRTWSIPWILCITSG